MSEILAGPWVGEFGWELFCWQGYLRNLSDKGDNILVLGRPGHSHLYTDFAEGFIEFDPGNGDTNMWTMKNFTKANEAQSIFDEYRAKGYEILKPFNLMGNVQQRFIRFGKSSEATQFCDILLHARSTTKFNTGYRNWDISSWVKLVERLRAMNLSVGFIGTREDSHYVHEALDFRGLPLDALCFIIRNSGIVIGPSSGPMHLASLCGTPHIVWTDRDTVELIKNRDRYKTVWNPLSTKVEVIDDYGWKPRVDSVMEVFKEFIHE